MKLINSITSIQVCSTLLVNLLRLFKTRAVKNGVHYFFFVCVYIVFPCTILIWIINRSWFIFQKFPQFFLIFIHLSIKFSRKYYIVCFHLFLSTYTSVTVLSKLIHTFISFFLPIFSLLCSTNYKRLDRLIRIKFQYMISYIPNIYTRHLTDVYCYSQPYLNFSSQYYPSQVEYISGSNINAQFGFQIACCEVYRNLIFSRITKKLQTCDF